MHVSEFQQAIQEGIPAVIPAKKAVDPAVNHAPKRKEILSTEEKKLALQNALRYFPKEQHRELIVDFLEELETVGRIYMHRYRPDYNIYARPISDYPGKSEQAKGFCLRIQNTLDPAVAQHPPDLIPTEEMELFFKTGFNIVCV